MNDRDFLDNSDEFMLLQSMYFSMGIDHANIGKVMRRLYDVSESYSAGVDSVMETKTHGF